MSILPRFILDFRPLILAEILLFKWMSEACQFNGRSKYSKEAVNVC